MRRWILAVVLMGLLTLAVVGCSSGTKQTDTSKPTAPATASDEAPDTTDDAASDRPLTAAEQVEFAIKPKAGEKMFVDGPAPDGEREAVLYERFNNFTSSGDPRWKVVDSQNEAEFDRYEFSDGSAIIFNRESRDMVDYLKSYKIE